MKAILRSVSRSFYLTIRWLPRPLREPVTLAYLLARATDTIADTAEISAEIRLTTLRKFAHVIAGEEDFSGIAETLEDFAKQQRDTSERTLIENAGDLIKQLTKAEPADRADIREVLSTIVRGQELDLQRFADTQEATSLRKPAELDEYTYLVAGCVGDFWTRLGFRHCPPFASRSPNEMKKLGIEYGKGLQLINILRDTAADRAAGRNYLPPNENFSDWLAKAEQQIAAGLDYCAALTSWRLRFATALPAMIGARTIALLRAAGPEPPSQKIKVSRRKVRRILVASLLAAASPVALRALFERLRA